VSERDAAQSGDRAQMLDLGATHDFGEDDIAAVAAVLRSGHLGLGPAVVEFEQAFAARHGVKHAVTASSGTAAMHTCIGALNPEPGSEIIVTPWTAGGSIIGALLHNCVPVFADVDDTYTLDPADVEAKITPRTRAIMAVHLFGNPCDMDALQAIADRHGVALIEDCCQAHFAESRGRIVGTIGDIAGFSFGGKHLSAGTGGAVLTNDDALWERAVLFRDAALPRDNGPLHGQPYANYFLAPNYKMGDLMAAVLSTQLQKVDGYIERKIKAAEAIIDGLSDMDEITPQRVRPGDRHSYWVLGLTLDTDTLGCSAWEFAEAVSRAGVPLGGPYIGSGRYGPLYRNPFLAGPNTYGQSRFPLDFGRETPMDYTQVECPRGEDIMGRGVSLQMTPNMSDAVIDSIVSTIRRTAAGYLARR
jgi:perosamine synthetase